jgi:UDP-glucose 4-epimerase
VGSGKDTSFNEIVNLINLELGTKIKPIYIDKPVHYVADTHFEAMDFQVKYGRPKVNMQEGIRRILNDQTV